MAVKAFRQTSSAAAAYRREARAYAVLRGSADGVAACYGVVVQDDETDEDDAEGRMCVRNPNMYQHALVLELCRGGSLADVLEGDILSSAKCIQVALRVSEALAALHGAGWSHGDMKPANVGFIGKGGEGVRLLDLGAARRTKEELCGEDEGEEALDGAGWSPREGAVRTGGTAAYRAPEAWKGRKALRGSGAATAADVWSLGILLWEIETWRRPWEGCSEWAIFGEYFFADISFSMGRRYFFGVSTDIFLTHSHFRCLLIYKPAQARCASVQKDLRGHQQRSGCAVCGRWRTHVSHAVASFAPLRQL